MLQMSVQDKYYLWGEIPQSDQSSINLTPQEKEGLMTISRPLTTQIDGPKFHSPLTNQKEMKMEQQCDPLVINTIQLLEYKRVLEKLLETVSSYKISISNGSLDKMPSCPPAPEMPTIVETPKKDIKEDITDDSDDVIEQKQRVMQLSRSRVRELLEKSVIRLTAHAGYQTSTNTALHTLTDATDQYLRQFCSLLRGQLDTRLEAAPDNSDGWSDALEQVCVEMRVGNTALETGKYSVLALGDYYQDCVVRRHRNLVRDVKQMTAQYEAGTSSWGQDDIPEMHFPSSDEVTINNTTILCSTCCIAYNILLTREQEVERTTHLITPLPAPWTWACRCCRVWRLEETWLRRLRSVETVVITWILWTTTLTVPVLE